jgi:hypothetical protein
MKLLSILISTAIVTFVLSACGGGGSDSSSNNSSSGVITNTCVASASASASASGAFTVTAAGCISNNQTLACQGTTMRVLSGSKTLAEVLAGGASLQTTTVNLNGVQYKCE